MERLHGDNHIRFGVCLPKAIFDELMEDVEKQGPGITRNRYIRKLVEAKLKKSKSKKLKNPAA